MCTFGVLGLSCASPGGPVWWGRRGFTRQPESPNVHIQGFGLQKHHQNSKRRHPERHKKSETVAGKGRKRAKFWAVRRRGVRRRWGPAEGGPGKSKPATTTTPTQQNNTTTQHNTKQQHKQHTTQQHHHHKHNTRNFGPKH